jgi:hypothetical protein
MLGACARKKARHDECVRCGAGWRPASSSTLRTEVAETGMPRPLSLADDPFVSPVRVLLSETKDQLAERALERRSPGGPVRVCPPAGDELAVPAKQCLWLDREDCPGRPGQRTAQRRQQRAISPRQLRPRGLPAENRQLVPEDEDLHLLRATRPSQQPYQREQAPNNEIHERPERTALPRPRQERRT